jgi:short-subunit dehydrogenase involved in D-alanine esterification of teichoic acids
MSELGLTSAEMVIQYGFAGFSIILLGILIWLLKRFLELQSKAIEALNRNTEVVKETKKQIQNVETITVDMKDKLQSRPCIAQQE